MSNDPAIQMLLSGYETTAKEQTPKKVSTFDVWLLVRDNCKSLVWAAAQFGL